MSKPDNEELQFDERYASGLGCSACIDRSICGGISARGLFDCWPLCCDDLPTCDYACPRNVEKFVEHMREIRTFEFNDIPRTEPLSYTELPHYIPLIYSNAANRRERLDAPFITIPLIQLINLETGKIRFQSRKELADHFGFSFDAKIIFSGVMLDLPLERYWYARNQELTLSLKKLGPILITSPNFSSFTNAPRWDNMFNLKRIAMCWSELVAGGIPTSLHMNARAPHDWDRWTDFIKAHPEVQSISFEFATVTGSRKSWYVRKLIALANRADRELQLVIRGGKEYFSTLSKAYKNVAFIDTDAFMKATMRQVINLRGEPITVKADHIDNHLKSNIDTRSKIMKTSLVKTELG